MARALWLAGAKQRAEQGLPSLQRQGSAAADEPVLHDLAGGGAAAQPSGLSAMLSVLGGLSRKHVLEARLPCRLCARRQCAPPPNCCPPLGELL